MWGFPESLVVAPAVFHSLLAQEQAVCDLAKGFSQKLQLNSQVNSILFKGLSFSKIFFFSWEGLEKIDRNKYMFR